MGSVNFKSQEEMNEESKESKKELTDLQQQQADLTMTLMMNGVI